MYQNWECPCDECNGVLPEEPEYSEEDDDWYEDVFFDHWYDPRLQEYIDYYGHSIYASKR